MPKVRVNDIELFYEFRGVERLVADFLAAIDEWSAKR